MIIKITKKIHNKVNYNKIIINKKIKIYKVIPYLKKIKKCKIHNYYQLYLQIFIKILNKTYKFSINKIILYNLKIHNLN